jgi:hypothetical protein
MRLNWPTGSTLIVILRLLTTSTQIESSGEARTNRPHWPLDPLGSKGPSANAPRTHPRALIRHHLNRPPRPSATDLGLRGAASSKLRFAPASAWCMKATLPRMGCDCDVPALLVLQYSLLAQCRRDDRDGPQASLLTMRRCLDRRSANGCAPVFRCIENRGGTGTRACEPRSAWRWASGPRSALRSFRLPAAHTGPAAACRLRRAFFRAIHCSACLCLVRLRRLKRQTQLLI